MNHIYLNTGKKTRNYLELKKKIFSKLLFWMPLLGLDLKHIIYYRLLIDKKWRMNYTLRYS